MIEKMTNRLNQALKNTEIDDFEKFFPLMLDDLEYILTDFKKEESSLSNVEQFKHSTDFTELLNSYFAGISKVYFKEMYGVDINIIKCDDYGLATAAAGYNTKDDNIYYTDFGATLSGKSRFSFLHTCLHEGRHKMQHDNYHGDDILQFPPYMLGLLKEDILSNALDYNNRAFYTTNYDMLLTENDSEMFAQIETYHFIRNLAQKYMKEHGLTDELAAKANRVDRLFAKKIDTEEFRIDVDQIGQISSGDLYGYYETAEGLSDRLIMMDKHIKENPELQDEYAILRLLFNGTTPKTYDEIVQDREKLKEGKTEEEQNQINRLYNQIIKLDPVLSLTDKLQAGDTIAAKEYLSNHPMMITEYPDEMQSLSDRYGNFSNIAEL